MPLVEEDVPHHSHRTEVVDATAHDLVCALCQRTNSECDAGELAGPCPASEQTRAAYDKAHPRQFAAAQLA